MLYDPKERKGGARMRGAGTGPGIAERFREKLRELDGGQYWDARNDRPVKMRFARDFSYDYWDVVRWLDGGQPSWDNVYRLARDLKVTPAWLLFGEDGGRQLMTSTSTPVTTKPRRSKRARVDVATTIGARGHTNKGPLCQLPR